VTVHLLDGDPADPPGRWCGVVDGAVTSTVTEVTCEACLRAAIAFGERCNERIARLRAFGDFATPMARKLASSIDADILAELAELAAVKP